MRRIGLHPGVYGTSIGLFITGGLAVLSATPVQSGILWLGEAAIALGVLLLTWGVKIDGEHWWKRFWPLRFPKFRHGQIYVGQIIVFDSELDTLHRLNMTVRGYNGTGRDRTFLGASGCVKLGYTLNGTGPEGVEMPSLGLVNPPTHIWAHREFDINFQQPMTPDQVTFFRQWEAQGADIQMMFESLAIMTKPTRFGRAERLSLWDGISLRNGRFFSRIVCVTGRATSRSSVTLGGKK